MFHRSVTAILAAVCLCAAVSTAQGGQAEGSAARKPSQAAVEQRIVLVFERVLKQGRIKLADGSEARTRVPPSLEDLEEVKGFGNAAVPVLSRYLGSNDFFQQELAMRFLGYLGGDRIVAPLEKVAKESPNPLLRSLAVGWLTQAPLKRSLPVIEHVSKSDPDPTVRREAKETLARYGKK